MLYNDDMEEELKEQQNNTKPWLFKKGQSGNPKGRPKGSISLKEWAKKYIRELSDEEKIEFLDGLPKEIIWKMAEGNPESKTDVTTDGKPIIVSVPDVVANRFNLNDKPDNKTEGVSSE